jgi:hypothetical protein
VRYRAAFEDRWKVIVGSDGRVELYDRVHDPGEEHNVVREHPEVASRLQQAVAPSRRFLPLDFRVVESGAPRRRFTLEQRRRLRALGYIH